MARVLQQRNFPVGEIRLLASERSVGRMLPFRGDEAEVALLAPDAFEGLDLVLSSTPAAVSRQYSPIAAKAGALVVDNSSAWRMDPEVPLVVPEVNPHAIRKHKGIIANPNCSTIQMVVTLKPLHDAARIRRVVVSTYQSVSGAGEKGLDELDKQVRAWVEGKEHPSRRFPHPIAFNVLPQVDEFLPNGYTKEEMKMLNETRKIMEDDSIQLSATTVRVPVMYGHSESITIETERKLTAEEAREILRQAPGIEVVDDVSRSRYPLAIDAAGRDAVFVGRVREDLSHPHGLVFWCVSDNIRKGAALNAVQIAERWLEERGTLAPALSQGERGKR
jgi:aspartate-semialdehyde dehydrogenase